MKTHSYYGAIALIFALATAVRIIAIPYFGDGLNGNPVDIYYVDREAARLILELKDPYLYSNYTNQIGGIVTFAYLPLVPVYYAPFVLIGADIRYGNILADLIITAALYFIGKSSSRTTSSRSPVLFSGSLAYAVLPTSIWLSAVTGSNMMIGSMFLIVALAFLLEGNHYILSSIFLGLALATNQFMVLVFPLVALYCFRNRQLKPLLTTILVSGAIVLPFFLYSPSRFAYDVLLFQFERPLQSNGLFSLYGLLYATTGFKIGTLYRLIVFLVPAAFSTFLFSKTKTMMLVGIAVVSALGAFLLPVDGFWSYFLLPMTMICALVPAVLTKSPHSEQASSRSSKSGE
ncbi:MAG: hypothetical protein OK474_05530 [Thaumarchaeota archaeon]|nr:hypothetical protein [Nitrososphaerota archaeon]